MKNTTPTSKKHTKYNLKPLYLILVTVFGNTIAIAAPTAPTLVADASQDNIEFDQSLINLPAETKKSTLQRFSKSNNAAPGVYRADIFVNSSWVSRRDVEIRDTKNKGSSICINRSLLSEMGIDYSKLPPAGNTPAPANNECIDIETVVPGMTADFDAGELRLDITLPQIYQRRTARGYVDPEMWTAGTPLAGFLNYNLNAQRSDQRNSDPSNSYYLSAQTGINFGQWRLRHNSSVTAGDNQDTRYQNLSTYLQRDLVPLRSTLTLGDLYTPADQFASFSFRGVQIKSDDRMLPESQTGYAPVIRGIADTNAKVTIKQGKNTIYETTVPAGQFQIDDLYSTGYIGDLQVTVTEADGRIKEFIVPYAAVPQLLRPGFSRFSVSAGELRPSMSSSSAKPGFVQATYQQGISNALTLFGGAITAKDYASVLFGSALSTPVGAIALDVTHSDAKFDSDTVVLPGKLRGESYRITYSNEVSATKTNFMLAAYRYSTENYMEFPEFAYVQKSGARTLPLKNRFAINVNQPLAERWGYLNLTGSTQQYWNRSGRDMQYLVGYNNSYKQLNYSVTASRTKNAGGEHVNQYMVNFSIPLGKNSSSAFLSSQLSTDSQHNKSARVAVSGTAGELNNYSYNVYAGSSQSNGTNDENFGAYGQYAGSQGTITASANQSRNNSSQMLGLSGGMVFHPGGITLSQPLGESFAVIEAKGAEGARIQNMNGTRINSNGYAISTNLMPYRLNDVSVDPKDMSENVELIESSTRIAPNSGAIVMVKFNTKHGEPAMVEIKLKSGASAPIGADVLQSDGTPVAVVGQGGRAFLRGQDNKQLVVRWGDSDSQQCQFSYVLPPQQTKDTEGAPTLRKTSANCR